MNRFADIAKGIRSILSINSHENRHKKATNASFMLKNEMHE